MVEINIGVLAIQGDFEAHIKAFKELGYNAEEVRTPEEIKNKTALVIPGGESTTMLKFFKEEGFDKEIIEYSKKGKPIFATCAGVILLSKKVSSPAQESLNLIDIEVIRNGYGRQINSTIKELKTIKELEPLEGVFIRAPRIIRVGNEVEVLAWFENDPVLLKYKNILASTFHPELSKEKKVQKWFLNKMVLNLEHTSIDS